ncbi:MAG: aspartate oxidase, partial [Thermoleophilaceae bacterium]|nr:aspartate oxidase [Thermoleophilaceae bacterium]
PGEGPSPVPPRGTREALWNHAGLRRDPAGLALLAEDPFPLARAIGRCALHREESRGAHRRVDAPELDAALDDHHTVVGSDEQPRFERWD